MSQRFKIVGTTADVAIVAYGESLQKLFIHAAEGLITLLTNPKQINKNQKKEIKLHGSDLENLMVKWLSEILYLFEVKEFLGKNFIIHSLDNKFLHSEVIGENFDSKKHSIHTEIKAITYHQLNLKRQKGQWMAKIIFDL